MIGNVRLVSEGGIADGTRVFCDNGTEIKGIQEAVIEPIKQGSLTVIRLTLCAVGLLVEGQPRFLVAHPRGGMLTEVKSITFADGETVDLEVSPQREPADDR